MDGEDSARVHLRVRGAERERVAHRVEPLPLSAADGDETPPAGVGAQLKMFDMTAPSEEEADAAPVAAFVSQQESVAATHGVVAPWTEEQLSSKPG